MPKKRVLLPSSSFPPSAAAATTAVGMDPTLAYAAAPTSNATVGDVGGGGQQAVFMNVQHENAAESAGGGMTSLQGDPLNNQQISVDAHATGLLHRDVLPENGVDPTSGQSIMVSEMSGYEGSRADTSQQVMQGSVRKRRSIEATSRITAPLAKRIKVTNDIFITLLSSLLTITLLFVFYIFIYTESRYFGTYNTYGRRGSRYFIIIIIIIIEFIIIYYYILKL